MSANLIYDVKFPAQCTAAPKDKLEEESECHLAFQESMSHPRVANSAYFYSELDALRGTVILLVTWPNLEQAHPSEFRRQIRVLLGAEQEPGHSSHQRKFQSS